MRDELVTLKEVRSFCGTERLRLIYIECEGGGWDFHSLVLEGQEMDRWNLIVVIDKEYFQGRCPYTRWISDLYSNSPRTGQAIIQIAEEVRPQGSFATYFMYSWHCWDLVGNIDLALLKICRSPSERL